MIFGVNQLTYQGVQDNKKHAAMDMKQCLQSWPSHGKSSLPMFFLGDTFLVVTMLIWLVVWNINFSFPSVGNNHPNWLSYFSEGFKPPTSFLLSQCLSILGLVNVA